MAEADGRGVVCHPMSAPIGYGASGFRNLYEAVPDSVAAPERFGRTSHCSRWRFPRRFGAVERRAFIRKDAPAPG